MAVSLLAERRLTGTGGFAGEDAMAMTTEDSAVEALHALDAAPARASINWPGASTSFTPLNEHTVLTKVGDACDLAR